MRKQVASCVAIGALSTAIVMGGVPAQASHWPTGVKLIPGTPYDDASDDWTEPLVIPRGFTQSLVADETKLDTYPEQDDLTDMNTVNETGPDAGRYLYRTQEVDENGSVSVVDLRTGKAKVLVQDASWNRLDGLRWTPWGTLLFAEEIEGGRLFEAFLDPNDPSTVINVVERTEAGVMRHEGIEALADGTVFVVDELNGGSIYKFVPATKGDLSDGQLYALKLTGLSDVEQLWNEAAFGDKVGAYEWVALDMNAVVIDTDAASNAVGATEFGRPEDVEVIGDTLYVANTTENRVVAIDLEKHVLSSFVQAGVNVPLEDEEKKITGFNGPDNLAVGPAGSLMIVEDTYLSDIWIAGLDQNRDGTADRVVQFASLKDTGAEVSGIYIGPDRETLYLNIQHPDKPLADGTWKVQLRWSIMPR